MRLETIGFSAVSLISLLIGIYTGISAAIKEAGISRNIGKYFFSIRPEYSIVLTLLLLGLSYVAYKLMAKEAFDIKKGDVFVEAVEVKRKYSPGRGEPMIFVYPEILKRGIAVRRDIYRQVKVGEIVNVHYLPLSKRIICVELSDIE
jgi:hypothetical protein